MVLFFSSGCGSSRDTARATPAEREKGGPAVLPERFAVNFMDTDLLSDAIERARVEGKLVFVDVYTTWCLPCRLMDEDVFSDPELGRYLNEHFVSLKVDAERGNGANLAAIYEVKAYPTLLFLDNNGVPLVRKQGAAYQTELRRLGEEARRAVP